MDHRGRVGVKAEISCLGIPSRERHVNRHWIEFQGNSCYTTHVSIDIRTRVSLVGHALIPLRAYIFGDFTLYLHAWDVI